VNTPTVIDAAEIISIEYGWGSNPVRDVESVAQQIKRTGRHPIVAGSPRRPGAHAAPWTPGRVREDARLGLECYQSTGRRVDRAFIGTAYPLLAHEAEAAVWTLGALQ